jgi:lysophospholipase L1-like esterase
MEANMRRISILLLAFYTCFALEGRSQAPARDRQSNVQWVSAWQGSPTPGGTFYSPGCPSDVGLSNQTVRNLVFLSTGGTFVRARISNTYGNEPLNVGSATIAVSAGGAAIAPQTLHQLSFSGQESILIAAGGEALTDPVAMDVNAFDIVAVSIFLPDSTGLATQHYFANQDNFLAAGDQTGMIAGTSFTDDISCWMFLSGIEVAAQPQIVGTVIVLGDSITDGIGSTNDANHRYPDFLAQRLAACTGPTLSVANAGVTGNELLTIRPQLLFGYSAPARLARDVLIQPGARVVILLEGINDIGDRSAKAEDLIPVDLQIIRQGHAAGMRIFGATLLPFAGSNGTYGGDYGTAAGEVQRQALNQWIRTSYAFDGVIDFDKAVRDRADPTRLLPAFDSGDHLHPNDLGYQAMANAIDLDAIIFADLSPIR